MILGATSLKASDWQGHPPHPKRPSVASSLSGTFQFSLAYDNLILVSACVFLWSFSFCVS